MDSLASNGQTSTSRLQRLLWSATAGVRETLEVGIIINICIVFPMLGTPPIFISKLGSPSIRGHSEQFFAPIVQGNLSQFEFVWIISESQGDRLWVINAKSAPYRVFLSNICVKSKSHPDRLRVIDAYIWNWCIISGKYILTLGWRCDILLLWTFQVQKHSY